MCRSLSIGICSSCAAISMNTLLAEDTITGMKLIHDVMYGPPEKCYYHGVSEIPALLVRKHGDGMAAVLPFQIGTFYREWGNQGHRYVAQGVIDSVLGVDRRLKVKTSPMVEVTHRKDPNGRFEWVALFNHSGRLGNSFHAPLPIHNVQIQLKTDRPVKQVTSLSNGQVLPEAGARMSTVTLPKLDAYEIVLVEYEER